MKNLCTRSGGICLAVVLVGASALPAAAGDRDWDGDQINHQIKRGREIVPPGVKLNLMGKNREMVWLGSYIVNTSGCIDCHSHPTYAPGGDPFKGEPEVVNANQYL